MEVFQEKSDLQFLLRKIYAPQKILPGFFRYLGKHRTELQTLMANNFQLIQA